MTCSSRDAPEDPVIAPQALSAPLPAPPDPSASLDGRKMRDALAEAHGREPASGVRNRGT